MNTIEATAANMTADAYADAVIRGEAYISGLASTHLDQWIERLIDKRTRSIDLFEKAAIGDQEARKKVADDPIIAHLQQRKEKFEFAARTLESDADFYLVLNPDELSIRETKRAVEQLDSYGLDVRGLAVNRLTPESDPEEEGRGATFVVVLPAATGPVAPSVGSGA